MKISADHQTETLEQIEVKEKVTPLNDLILYNDDFNTFGGMGLHGAPSVQGLGHRDVQRYAKRQIERKRHPEHQRQ